jgi:hypothetical protein
LPITPECERYLERGLEIFDGPSCSSGRVTHDFQLSAIFLRTHFDGGIPAVSEASSHGEHAGSVGSYPYDRPAAPVQGSCEACAAEPPAFTIKIDRLAAAVPKTMYKSKRLFHAGCVMAKR